MASGFKSTKQTIKSPKKLSIANAIALTEKMQLVFSEIEDPRVERTRVHLLKDILIIRPLAKIFLVIIGNLVKISLVVYQAGIKIYNNKAYKS